MSIEYILNKYGGREIRFLADASLVGRFADRCFGVSDSIKNNGVCDTHRFSWKFYNIGGDIL
jgi:hypothetical protein